MTNRFTIMVVVLLATGLTMNGCHKPKDSSGQDSDTKFKITDTLLSSLLIDTVQEANALSQITLTGSIAPDENKMVKVFPMVSGIAGDVHVQLGDVVQKGQTLAIMRSSEIAAYNKDYQSAEADLKNAKRNQESTQDMFKSGLASQRDLEDAEAGYQKALAEYKRSNSVIQINKSDSRGYEIKAPISGFVIEKNIANDAQIRADNSQNLFTIADLSDVYVLINIYESDITSVQTGDPVKITTLSYPDKVFEGKIDRIDNMLDPDNKVIKARVKIANPGNMLKPDMFANVVISAKSGEDLPVINANTIIFDNDKNYVLVVTGKASVRIQPIIIAKKVEDRAYISSGIKPGDRIVASRQVYLFDSLKD